MRILIVKTSSLGDIIHAYPVIDYLRQRYPEAKIDWVVEKPFAELITSHPYINKALFVETKKWRKNLLASRHEIFHFRNELQSIKYDVAFDLQGNIKSGLILSQVKAKTKVGFGWKTLPEKPNGLFTRIKFNPTQSLSIREENLFIVQSYFHDQTTYNENPIQLKLSPDEEKQLQEILSKLQGRKVMVCPGSAWPNKQVTPESLVGFLKKLPKCTFVFAWGSEKELIEVKDLADEFPENSIVLKKLCLPILQNLMKHMDLVVAMDSLPLHLAGTTGVPIYGIFGPSSATKYMPAGINNRSCQGTCPYGRTFNRRCPILRSCPTGLCTKALTGEQLFQSFKPTKGL